MSTKDLEARGRELTARLGAFAKDFEQNESISEAEKETAYKALSEEFAQYESALKRSEGASALAAKLAEGGSGTVLDAKGSAMAKYEMQSPLNRRGLKALAAEVVENEEVAKLFGFKDGFRKRLDAVAELGLKTTGATEGANLMGESVYGSTNPPAGQSGGFMAGAFGPGILPDYRPGVVEQLLYELTIADLISSFATSAPVVSYLSEQVVAATPLPNWSANAQPEMGVSASYPFSSTEFIRSYAQVGKIANAMTLSDEAIADAPTLFNFVQGRLLTGLLRQEEVQLLAGSGTFGASAGDGGVAGLLTFASNFTANSGATAQAGASSASVFTSTPVSASYTLPPAFTGAGVTSQAITFTAGRAVTAAPSSGSGVSAGALALSLNLKDAAVDIELAVFQSPNVHIMHPRTWQLLETAQDANAQFMNTSMFGNVYGVSRGPVKSLWGVPVVTTPLLPPPGAPGSTPGLVITGWFDPQTIQVARRQGVQFQMTNSNESDFVQGRVTLRADSRLGLLCYRPSAFEVTQVFN